MALKRTRSELEEESGRIIDLAMHRMRTDAVVKEHRSDLRGRWFKIFMGISLFFGLVVLGSLDYVFQTPGSSVTEDGLMVVTLKQDRQGHYFAKGKINNETVNFLLDTGATSVAIPESVAKRLQLPYGERQQYFTANGMAHGFRTRLKTISLGGIEKRYIDAAITPGMTGDHILLGMSFLKSLDIRQSGGVMEISLP